MQSSFKRIVTGILVFGLTVAIAVTGYIIAGWTPLDAIYMVVITVFGVGYGEVQPLSSPHLKVFTILVIIAGVLSVAYTVSGFVQLITEGEIRKLLDVKRMTHEIECLENHVIICGFGRMGQLVAHHLKTSHYPFVVVDSDPERIGLAQERGYLAYLGNATDEGNLEIVQIHKARALATVLPDDAANVFITLTAREMSSQLMILARGEVPSTEKKLRLAGANHVVLPATISASRMANLITNPSAVDFLTQIDQRAHLSDLLAQLYIQLTEVVVDTALAGYTIGDLAIRGKGAFIIVALRRADGEIIIHPGQSVYFKKDDILMLMGHQDDLPTLAQQAALRREMRYRGAQMR